MLCWRFRACKSDRAGKTMARSALFVVLLLIFAPPCLGAAPQELDVHEIAPGVIVHNGQIALMTKKKEGDIAKVSCVVGSDDVTMNDSGSSVHENQQKKTAIRARTDKPIRYVVN